MFCILLPSCIFFPFSRPSSSVSEEQSGSCYSHSDPTVTTVARHVSILHWRRTRQGVNTTVLGERERWRKQKRGRQVKWWRAERRTRKTEREVERNKEHVWPESDTSRCRREATNKWRHEKELMELDSSCEMRKKTGSDMLRRSPHFSWVQMFTSILTHLRWLIGCNFLLY